MAQARAKVGGEIGANGEFYDGGKFIATKDNAKKQVITRRPTGRQEVAPFVWEVVPEGNVALYPRLNSIIDAKVFHATGTAKAAMSNFYQEHKQYCDNLISLWNQGIRWTPKN